MNKREIENLAKLRVLVGFLGEKDQYAWWPCSFYSKTSQSFLLPVYGRTLELARYHGICEAALRAHDEHIGVGNVYHLFRLPENLEQQIHSSGLLSLQDSIQSWVLSGETAIAALEELCSSLQLQGEGPVRVGGVDDLRKSKSWVDAAAFYFNAFLTGKKVHPFFADR